MWNLDPPRLFYMEIECGHCFWQVAVLRRELNENLPQFIGEYYHIDGRMTLPPPKTKGGGKRTMPLEVKLDDKNTLFVDIEVVQRSMVMFYGITVEGMWN